MSWKNLSVFHLPADFSLSAEDLTQALSERPLREPGPLELETHGFVPAVPPSDQLGHTVGGNATLVRLGSCTRILPASVVNDAINERITAHEAKTGRKPGKRLRMSMREEVLGELLPRAFIRRGNVNAYWDSSTRTLAVSSASDKACERLASILRDALGSLPARPWASERPVALAMTEWVLSGQLPEGFELGDECEFKDPADERSTVRCRRMDLSSDEVRDHARTGKQISQLALVYRERIAFVLDARLHVRKIALLDVATETLANDSEPDEMAIRDAEATLMIGEFRELLQALHGLFPPIR